VTGVATSGVDGGAEPEISVVVPTYRRPHLLKRMVAALEAQTLPLDRFDVTIVDNASPDDTTERLGALAASTPLRLRHLVEPRPGPAATRNTGWRASTAPLLAFVDDDCVPEPGWLAAGLQALTADPGLGVVQGCTRKPEGAQLGDWTLWRQITAPTPWFEGCNIFYRRAALEAAGGFDEEIQYYTEDTSLGWSVVEQGWERGYAERAVAFHDVEERGLRYHLQTGLLERNVARIAKHHPAFREDAFWRPYAFRGEGVAFAFALAGVLVARRSPPVGVALLLPYLRMRLPPREHPRRGRFFFERVLVDAAQFAGMRWGSVQHGVLIV
jgi:GT2 family glycosyltransferase